MSFWQFVAESYSCRAVVVIPIRHYPIMNHLLKTHPSLLTSITSRKSMLASKNHISTWGKYVRFCASIYSPNPENSRSLPAERTGTASQMFCSIPLKIQPEYLN